MTDLLIPTDSIATVDRLLGQATLLTADRWDDTAAMIAEAMGIALLMSATHPTSRPAEVPGLAGLGVLDCVEESMREVGSWDLALAADLPDLARLRVLLSDVRGDLLLASGRRG